MAVMNLYNALQLQNGQIPTPLPRSSRDVNNNENNQIGLVNANAQANLNLSLVGSGGVAAGTSLIGAGAAAATTTSTTTIIGGSVITETITTTAAAGAWIPVAGQVVAVVAAIVGIAQMIDTADKQKRWQSAINQKNNQIKLIQQEITTDLAVAEYSIQLLRDEISAREDILKTNRILLIGSITVLAVSGMVLLYLINKNKK